MIMKISQLLHIDIPIEKGQRLLRCCRCWVMCAGTPYAFSSLRVRSFNFNSKSPNGKTVNVPPSRIVDIFCHWFTAVPPLAPPLQCRTATPRQGIIMTSFTKMSVVNEISAQRLRNASTLLSSSSQVLPDKLYPSAKHPRVAPLSTRPSS